MAQDGIIERLLGASAGSARMFAALAGDVADVDEAYELVTSTMQRALDKLDAERRLPVVG